MKAFRPYYTILLWTKWSQRQVGRRTSDVDTLVGDDDDSDTRGSVMVWSRFRKLHRE